MDGIYKRPAFILMYVLMVVALVNIIVLAIWYSDATLQKGETSWPMSLGWYTCCQPFATVFFLLLFTKCGVDKWWYYSAMIHFSITCIINLIDGVAMAERGDHYKNKCDMHKCQLLITYSFFALIMVLISPVLVLLHYKDFKNAESPTI